MRTFTVALILTSMALVSSQPRGHSRARGIRKLQPGDDKDGGMEGGMEGGMGGGMNADFGEGGKCSY